MVGLHTSKEADCVISHYVGTFNSDEAPTLMYPLISTHKLVAYNEGNRTERLECSPTPDGPWVSLSTVRSNQLREIPVSMPYIRLRRTSNREVLFWVIQYQR